MPPAVGGTGRDAASPAPGTWNASDLAPGDGKSLRLDASQLTLGPIRSTGEPGFAQAYGALWDEFGARGELERVDVLERRFRWSPGRETDGWKLLYEMLEIVDRSHVRAAVRDHSIIVPPTIGVGGRYPVTVHLSHVLVAPSWRRNGLAGWMRALPLLTARGCLADAGIPARDAEVTLVAEMEPASADAPEQMVRLAAYEKAGFLAVDPAQVPYHQPDFRSSGADDAARAVQPLPMLLIIRRVSREHETTIDGGEVRELIDALYRMYADGTDPDEIRSLASSVKAGCPRCGEPVALVPPIRAGGKGALRRAD